MKQLNIKPSEFAESFLSIERGKPFSIRKYPFFYPVYDSPSDNILLRCSRQVGKSLTIANFIALNTLVAEMQVEYITNQNYTRDELYEMGLGSFHTLYVAPRFDQVGTFSRQKLNPIIGGTNMFRNFVNSSCYDQVNYKSFKNNSDIFLRSCFYSPDSIRGISSDMICIDEIQDIQTDHIPVIVETQLRSSRKYNLRSGTPKSTRNTIEYFWEKTSQNEWAVPCKACGKWNILGEENIQPLGPSCNKVSCRKLLNVKDGQWVSMNPEAYSQGFRAHAMMADFIPWNGDKGTKAYESSYIYKYENYPRAKFYNEVLGLPYDSGSAPITAQDLMAACDMDERRKVGLPEGMVKGLIPSLRSRPLALGIDWGSCQEGKGRTVLSVVACVDNKFHLIFAKIFTPAESDPKFQVEQAIKFAKHFGCMMIGADYGFGHMQNYELAAGFGTQICRGQSNRVIQMENVGRMSERRRFDEKARRYRIERTEVMTDLFQSIKSKKVLFPTWKEFEPFTGDILNIYQEYNETTRMMRYDHHPDQTDDFFFSLLYAIEALLIMMKKPSI